jgi:hypothetical protein
VFVEYDMKTPVCNKHKIKMIWRDHGLSEWYECPKCEAEVRDKERKLKLSIENQRGGRTGTALPRSITKVSKK